MKRLAGMDATAAMQQTGPIVTDLIAGLTPANRETSTPCADWNVHELIEHMCQGGQMVAGALQDQAPPEDGGDLLSDGPAAGWAATAGALSGAATPDALGATHEMPFDERNPGTQARGDQRRNQATRSGTDDDEVVAARRRRILP